MAAVPFGYIHEAQGPFLTTQPRAKGQRLASPRESKPPQHEYDNRAIFMHRRKAILSCPDLSRHLQATFSSLNRVRPLLCTQPLFTLTLCVCSQSLAITLQPTFLLRRHAGPNSSSGAWPPRNKLWKVGPLPPRHVLLLILVIKTQLLHGWQGNAKT